MFIHSLDIYYDCGLFVNKVSYLMKEKVTITAGRGGMVKVSLLLSRGFRFDISEWNPYPLVLNPRVVGFLQVGDFEHLRKKAADRTTIFTIYISLCSYVTGCQLFATTS